MAPVNKNGEDDGEDPDALDDHDQAERYRKRKSDKRAEALGDLLLADALGLAPAKDSEGSESGMPALGWLHDNFKTTSAIIRHLYGLGHSVNAIHKHTGIRYQHVRNVLKTELKRGPHEEFSLAGGKVSSMRAIEEAHPQNLDDGGGEV